eukprot:TRINITY_DN16976_c0_g1_i1.p2 TRINITY_DN16976_c0_g1~~TRINITY_DN16976_c0_g1_i1.p2  ORF type:complete len:321 (-),score=105.65 TRINITY_DN16976_c0_g1_i1:64-1026(-)
MSFCAIISATLWVVLAVLVLCKVAAWILQPSYPVADVPNGVVLVTGASRGIGAGIAKVLHKNKYTVFAGVRQQKDYDKLAAGLRDPTPGALNPLHLDMNKPEDIDAAARTVSEFCEQHHLPFVALVNNAGTAVTAPIENTTPELLNDHFNVHIIGALRMTRALLPLLKKHHGRVISTGSCTIHVSPVGFWAYVTCKAAQRFFCTILRNELKPWGIAVTYLCIGTVVDSEINNDFRVSSLPADFVERWTGYDKLRDAYVRVMKYAYMFAFLKCEGVGASVLGLLRSRRPSFDCYIGMDSYMLWLLNYLPCWDHINYYASWM